VAADLCYTKAFERLFLFYHLRYRVKGLWPPLRETKHILESLSVSKSAVARYRVVLCIDHRVVHTKPGLLKNDRLPKAGKRLVAAHRPGTDHPDNHSAVRRLSVKRIGDLLERKMIAVV